MADSRDTRIEYEETIRVQRVTVYDASEYPLHRDGGRADPRGSHQGREHTREERPDRTGKS